MFQFPGFAPHNLCIQLWVPNKLGGFPHSDTPGSKLVYQLPEAFRRLPRPSSPVAAKASTMCAYSLDHITPSILFCLIFFTIASLFCSLVRSHTCVCSSLTLKMPCTRKKSLRITRTDVLDPFEFLSKTYTALGYIVFL